MKVASTLTQRLAQIASRAPATLALRYGEQTIDFHALDAASRRLAHGFSRLGVRPGDRVALWLPNTPAWLACFFACARLGAIALATNTRFRAAEMENVLCRSEAKLLVYWPAFRGIDFDAIVQDLGSAATHALRAIVAYREASDPPPPARIGTIAVHAYDALANGPELESDAATLDAGCLMFTTSGTTKAPKFVLHSQRSIGQHAIDVARAFDYLHPETVGLGVLPFCGTFGFSTALAPLLAGHTLVVEPSFAARRLADSIARHRVTNTNLTGMMIAELLAAAPEGALRSIRFCGCGSGCAEVIAEAAAHGLRLAGVYGSSEVQALFSHQNECSGPLTERGAGGGRPVSSAAQVRVRDVHSGALLSPGTSGELEIRAPSQLLGYFGDEAASRDAFSADGFFRTGDMGHTLADGRFIFEARMGDVLRLSGFLVSPVQIESVLAEHPSVAACQVVGVERDGEARAVAFVTVRPGARFDEAAVLDHARTRMARYKVPERVVLVDDFPTIHSANAVKVQKGRLREMASALCAVGRTR